MSRSETDAHVRSQARFFLLSVRKDRCRHPPTPFLTILFPYIRPIPSHPGTDFSPKHLYGYFEKRIRHVCVWELS